MFCVLSSSLMMSCSAPQYARTAAPQEPIVESLFAEKDRTISEENIQKLLDGKLIRELGYNGRTDGADSAD